MTALAASVRSGPALSSRRSLLNLLSLVFLVGAAIMLGKASWIHIKAQVAQALLERAFTQSVATGMAVKPWSWADTWPVAKVEVPRLGRSEIVLQGVTGEALAFGPGLLTDAAAVGEAGTTVIAAHRDTHFRFLQYVHTGDFVSIQRTDGLSFRYRVTGMRVVPWDNPGIDRNRPGHHLVLSTCYPFDAITHGSQRYLVEAEMM